MSAPQIAEELSGGSKAVSAETVRRALRKLGVREPSLTFAEVVKGMGYSSLRSFFLNPSIARLPRGEVAKMTGHTAQTVWNHWNGVRQEVRQECLAGA